MSNAGHHFLLWLLTDKKHGAVRYVTGGEEKKRIRNVAIYIEKFLNGETVTLEDWRKAARQAHPITHAAMCYCIGIVVGDPRANQAIEVVADLITAQVVEHEVYLFPADAIKGETLDSEIKAAFVRAALKRVIIVRDAQEEIWRQLQSEVSVKIA